MLNDCLYLTPVLLLYITSSKCDPKVQNELMLYKLYKLYELMCGIVVSHLEEDVCKFNSNAVPGATAEGTEEVLLACIPAHAKT